DTEIDPLDPPKQLTFETTDHDAVRAAGSETVAVQVAVQPWSSVTVNVYVPAASPDWIPVPEYGAVPPEAETDIDPLLPPAQLTFEATEHDAESAAGSVTVAVHVAVQP